MPSGPLGRRWGRFSLPGWFPRVSTAHSTLSAAETVLGGADHSMSFAPGGQADVIWRKADIQILMSGYGGIADSLAHLSECPLIAEAVEKVGEHSSRIVLPQQSKLGGTMFESLLRRSVCWRINLSPRTPRNTFSTASARSGHSVDRYLFHSILRTKISNPGASLRVKFPNREEVTCDTLTVACA